NAGGDVENAVVGDGNKTTQNSGDNSAVGGFGSGDATNIPGSLDDGPTIMAGGCYTGGTDVADNDTAVDTRLDVSGLDDDYTPCDKRAGFEDNDAIVGSGDATFAVQ
ncbi:hypothetical protein ALI22I_13390, partial [Saccharothrix sp. ALI-22-I]|uniref:hypothetical protein n=1 Tax=Saccharothrix sp. ALI-22-I TaxID=1933778 RepID=UPI0009CF5B69